MNKITSAILIAVIASLSTSADYRLVQQRTMGGGMSQEFTIYAKGVRLRWEGRTIMQGLDPRAAAMAANMMPPTLEISQCDLNQNVQLNEQKKTYFIEYYNEEKLTPEQKARRSTRKATIKGTMTISSVVTDSGRRQEMFGLSARWMKTVRTFEQSADACDGAKSLRFEEEGWYVRLMLSNETCDMPKAPPSEGGCRPRLILKSMQDAGFLLEGKTTMYVSGKASGSFEVKTTALSTLPLAQSLFEIPKDWTEVDSLSELMPGFSNDPVDTSAKTTIVGNKGGVSRKSIAVDFFSGNASKLNQTELRSYIAGKVDAAGFAGVPVSSQSDIATGKFGNVIGVDIKRIKESGGAKLGGLFGKITGSSDMNKLGESEAEIVITLYANDGKTIVGTATATEKVKGKPDDAVRAAIDRIIGGLISKIK